ncbi:MAG: hypothetical protein Q8L75_04115 [Acidobacteriota bacterium]|nr:hypothetical protein [Acidobacteriota bacterium]
MTKAFGGSFKNPLSDARRSRTAVSRICWQRPCFTQTPPSSRLATADPGASTYRGSVFSDLERAAVDYRRALAADPTHVAARIRLAWIDPNPNRGWQAPAVVAPARQLDKRELVG